MCDGWHGTYSAVAALFVCRVVPRLIIKRWRLPFSRRYRRFGDLFSPASGGPWNISHLVWLKVQLAHTPDDAVWTWSFTCCSRYKTWLRSIQGEMHCGGKGCDGDGSVGWISTHWTPVLSNWKGSGFDGPSQPVIILEQDALNPDMHLFCWL